MNECFQKVFLLDGKSFPCNEFRSDLVYDHMSIYEVIRIIDGVPLFQDDHFDRLFETARIKNLKIILERSVLAGEMNRLISFNKVKTGNIKIVLTFNEDAASHHRQIYFIEHYYPKKEQYLKGVTAILYQAERMRPAAKVINHRLRSSIFGKLIDTGAYEAFLVDRSGCITEGSRSNVFFISNDEIYTAPDGEVLSGIVRKYVLKYCDNHGIPVHFCKVRTRDLSGYQSCFLTGTSPGVLPVSRIGQISLHPGHKLMLDIMQGYQEMVQDYIHQFKV